MRLLYIKGGLHMSRLEMCMNQLKTKNTNGLNAQELYLLYQEFMNYLPTYKEKKALDTYFLTLTS